MAKEKSTTVSIQPAVLPALVDAIGTSLAPVYDRAAAEYDVTQHEFVLRKG